MQKYIKNTPEELTEALAEWICSTITEVLAKQQQFSIALAGGSTPKKLYELLAASPFKEKIDWRRLHIFWGDERYVPLTDDQSNAKMAFISLLDKVPIPIEQIHVMDSRAQPEASAEAYEQLLHEHFGNDKTFDLVLLGMGDDGHTLSIFPGSPLIHEEERWVCAIYSEVHKMYRITLTIPVVKKAMAVAFMVTGAGKAEILKHVIEGDYQPDQYPSQLVAKDDNVHWFIDKDAASLLSV